MTDDGLLQNDLLPGEPEEGSFDEYLDGKSVGSLDIVAAEIGAVENLKAPIRDKVNHALPDYLDAGLDMVFIGINPGYVAAETGKYYAGSGNHFWTLLFMSGLTKTQLNSDNDFELPQHGIGLTNVVERTTKGSADLSKEEIKAGSEILLKKLELYKPKIAVFNGKEIYKIFSGKKDFCFGKQPERLMGTNILVYVMPNSSARCAQLPKATDKLPYYEGLRKLRDFVRGELPDLQDSEITFCGTLKSPAKRTSGDAETLSSGIPENCGSVLHVKQEPCIQASLQPSAAKRSLMMGVPGVQMHSSGPFSDSWDSKTDVKPVMNTSVAMHTHSSEVDQHNQQYIMQAGSLLNPGFDPSNSKASTSTAETFGMSNSGFSEQAQEREHHYQLADQYGHTRHASGYPGNPPVENPLVDRQDCHGQSRMESPAFQSHPKPVFHAPSPSVMSVNDPELIGMHIAESVAAVVQRCKDGTLEFPEHYIRPSDPPPVKHTSAPPSHQPTAQQPAAAHSVAANQLLAGLTGQSYVNQSNNQAAQALESYLTPYLQNQQQQMYQQAIQVAGAGTYPSTTTGGQWPPGFYDYLRQGSAPQSQQQQQQNQAQLLQQQQDLYAPYFTGGMMYGQQPGGQNQAGPGSDPSGF